MTVATPTEHEGVTWAPPRWMRAVVRCLMRWSLRDARDLRTFIDRCQTWAGLTGQITAELGRAWWPYVARDTVATLAAQALAAQRGQPETLKEIAEVLQQAVRAVGSHAPSVGEQPDHAVKEE